MDDKLRETRLRWPTRKMERLERKTFMDVVKTDIMKCNLSENLAQDRSEWGKGIH